MRRYAGAGTWLIAGILGLAPLRAAAEETSLAERLEAALGAAARERGSHYRQADPLAALGPAAVPLLAKIVADEERPPLVRALCADALGRIVYPAARAALTELSALDLDDGLRFAVDAARFRHGDREAIDGRAADLAIRHRELPIAAEGSLWRLAELYARTGRLALAVRCQRAARDAAARVSPDRAASHAYNVACYAALAGDREAALAAAIEAAHGERTDLDWMAEDPDLDAIRDAPEFRKALEDARAARVADSAASSDATERADPRYAEWEELKTAYWDGAFESWLDANNQYWGEYSGWLESSGREHSEATEAEWRSAHGAPPPDPTPDWIPRFREFLAKAAGGPLESTIRGTLLALFGNEEMHEEWLSLFFDAVEREAPDPATVRLAGRAYYPADRLGRAEELRWRLEKLLPRLSGPEAAAVYAALAEMARSGNDPGETVELLKAAVAAAPGSSEAQEAEDELYRLSHLAPGRPAPDFTAADVHGNGVSLAEMRGRVVLLDFWATWCGPCIGEIPHLKAARRQFPETELAMVSISLDEDGWALAEFLAEEDLPWIHLADPAGWRGRIPELYRINAVPTLYLLDREGKIAAVDPRGEALIPAIEAALAR